MSTTLLWAVAPEGTRRHGSLVLAIALHAGLVAAAWQGLQSRPVQQAPREVVISLLSLASEAASSVIEPRPAPAALPAQASVTRPALPSPSQPTMPVQPAAQPVQQVSTPTAAPAPVVAHEPAVAAVPAVPAHPAPIPEARSIVPAVAAVAPAPASATAAPAPRGPVTVSGVEYLNPPKVDYPISARRAGLEGKVMLRLLIDEKGQPQRADVQQSSGYPRLDEAARTAALRALFKPHLEDGQPMPVYALVPISFSLK